MEELEPEDPPFGELCCGLLPIEDPLCPELGECREGALLEPEPEVWLPSR